MIPNRDVIRPSDTEDLSKSLRISSESHNVCYIDHLNRIQNRLSRDIETIGRGAIGTRFWSKVNKTADCWLWTASKMDRQGHGQFTYRLRGRQYHVYAHRVAYTLCVESIPDGLVVCHHCDVPACVNPDHLFVGTQGDNLRDASRKGRFTVPRTSKLSLEDRLTIQASTEPRAVLAARYGVTPTWISVTRRGQFVGAAVPVRGELHVRECLTDTAQIQRQ
jgi:hypothetical protein